MRAIYSVILFVILSGYSALAQHSSAVFRQLSEDQGLPGATVRCLFQDSKGMVWLGVESTGLCFYDGYTFTLFESKQNDSTSLCNNIIESIAEDSNGDIWVGTQDGLSVFSVAKQQFRSFRRNNSTPHSMPGNVVYDILYTKQHYIFIATDRGVAFSTPPYNDFRTVCLLHNKQTISCYDVYESHDGAVWVGTNVGLFKVSAQGEVIASWLNDDPKHATLKGNITAIAEDEDKNLWFGCDWRLLKLTKEQTISDPINYLSVTNKNTGSFISKIHLDNDGAFWIGTAAEGISIFDPNNLSYTHLTAQRNNPEGLKSQSVRDIMADCSGNIWIGLKFAGIQIFDPRQQMFQCIDKEDQKANNDVEFSVISVYEDRKSRIWIGTARNGLLEFDRQKKRVIAVPAFELTRINTIDEDANGNLLLATATGVLLFNPQNNSRKKWEIGNVVALKVDKQGCVWAGTTQGLYRKTENSSGFEIFENGCKPFNSSVNCKVLFEDADEQLWLGTLQNGLYVFDKERKNCRFFEQNNNPHSISGNLIRYIFQDSKQRIWISTRGQGLNLFNPKTCSFKHFNELDGLPSNTLFGITEDNRGNLWLSSYKGIGRFNPDNATADCFTKEFGLQHDVFEPQATCCSKSGEIFFGGEKGLNYFHPQHIVKKQQKFPLIITSVKIENSTIATNITDTLLLELAWDQNYISFDFSLLDFVSRQGIRYSYRLEGFDKKLQTTENRHSATYTNLEPGTYLFKLWAVTKDGSPCSNAPVVRITIVPPFWKTWWFRILLVILSSGVIYLYFVIRLRSIKKRNAQLEIMVRERTLFLELQKEELLLQKEKFQQQSEELVLANKKLQQSNHTKDTLFSVISHDLKNPFNIILRFSENVLTKYYSLDEQKKFQYISHIQSASKSIYALLENLLNWYKVQSGVFNVNLQWIDLHTLADSVINEYSLVALEKQIEIRNNVAGGLQIEADVDMLSTVIRNFVNNAIKFTPQHGLVTIEGVLFDSRVEIAVTDSGVGMSETELESLLLFLPKSDRVVKEGAGTGLGLQICKQLIDLMHGVLEVKSGEMKGSRFSVLLPMREERNTPTATAGGVLYSSWLKDLRDVDSIIEADKKALFNKKVLIVDDNVAILDHLQDLLQNMYKVLKAQNGNQAYEIAAKELPDIIVTDLVMPLKNGLELTQCVKENKKTQHIPVILLTAQSSDEIAVTAYNCGVTDFIAKPFDDRIVRLKIRNVLLLRETFRIKSGIEETVASIPNATRPDDVFMAKLFETIRQNIENQGFDVETLAAEMGMSKSTLLRKLHQFTDKSPWELIVEIRFEKAKELLKTGKYSVSEVAWAIGLSDVKYFSRRFKEIYGTVPKDIARNTNRND